MLQMLVISGKKSMFIQPELVCSHPFLSVELEYTSHFPPFLCWRSSLDQFCSWFAMPVFRALPSLLEISAVFHDWYPHWMWFRELLWLSLLVPWACLVWKNIRGNAWQHLFSYRHRLSALWMFPRKTKLAQGEGIPRLPVSWRALLITRCRKCTALLSSLQEHVCMLIFSSKLESLPQALLLLGIIYLSLQQSAAFITGPRLWSKLAA